MFRTRLHRPAVWIASGFTVLVAAFVAWDAPQVWAWWWSLKSPGPHPLSPKAPIAAGVAWQDDYFIVQPLGNRVFAIGEPRYYQCNFSYLILGTRSALLFDAGPGVRNIVEIVHRLTALPVQALPSHLHFDHVGGLGAFNDIALPDLPDLRQQAVRNRITLRRNQHLGYLDGVSPPTLVVTSWIRSGSEIELGGRSVRLVSLPGHTPDSVALIDKSSNRVFAGDFIYPDTLFAFLPGADVKAYKESALRLLSLTQAETMFYGAHGCEQSRAVEAPAQTRTDLEAMARTLSGVVDGTLQSTGLFPRQFNVNDRMWLWAKYQWMR